MATEDLNGMGKAIAPLTEGLAKLGSKLFSESAEVIGEFSAEWLRERFRGKAKNMADILEMADLKLTSNGADPQPISNKLLYGFLDGASLEDDETVQQLWAGLLATALQGLETHPAYPTILRQLTPLEAKILNVLFLEGKSSLSEAPVIPTIRTIPLSSFLAQETFTEESLIISTENLCRLNLCTLEPIKSYVEMFEEGLLDTPKRFLPSIPQFNPPTSPFAKRTSLYPEIYEEQIQLTNLGHAFVKACQP
jgi:hypothetical protein